MKLLQNSAGNFLNLTPQEAKKFAEQLLDAAEKSLTAERGGAGFVQTIVLSERLSSDPENRVVPPPVLDTVFVGISPTWLDVHPSLEEKLRPRDAHILHIDRNAVNVRLKEGQ
jgi:hypothetical protein